MTKRERIEQLERDLLLAQAGARELARRIDALEARVGSLEAGLVAPAYMPPELPSPDWTYYPYGQPHIWHPPFYRVICTDGSGSP